MSELIWVGNYLIPREVVIATATVAFLIPFAIVGIVQYIQHRSTRGMK